MVAEPVHGLRAPLHVLLRAGVRGARRPRRGRPLRSLDPRSRSTSPRSCGASSRARHGSARRSTIGAATDPYQPAEGRYRLTRACIARARPRAHAVLAHHPRADGRGATSTCSPRPRAARRCTSRLGADARRADLAHDRARALRRRGAGSRSCGVLAEAGIDDGVALAPLLPGLSDDPAAPREVVRAARAAGARAIWANVLYLRPGTREHFLEALARDWPELLARYERLYDGRAYLPATVTDRSREHVRRLARETAPCAPADAPARAPSRSSSRSPSESTSRRRRIDPVPENRRSGRERRDHRPDRGRPRGRARGPAPRAAALGAHPRRRRGAPTARRRWPWRSDGAPTS